jgi:hypothetical protein
MGFCKHKWQDRDIEPQWEVSPDFFYGGLARVYGEESSFLSPTVLMGYIDKTGKYIWEMQK